MTNRRPPATLFGPLVVALVVALTLAACGLTHTSTTTTKTSGAALTKIGKVLASYESPPSPTIPSAPSFNASAANGKLVYEICYTDQDPWCLYQQKAIAQAASLAHVRLVTWSNQGESSQIIAGIQNAIAAHANAVILTGEDPATLRPYISDMVQAHIGVISQLSYTAHQALPPNIPGIVYVAGGFTKSAELAADWAIYKSKGAADALFITSNEVPNSSALYAATQAEFRSQCPHCVLSSINVPTNDWSSDLASEVESALDRNPKINWVIPVYDSASTYVVSALRAINASNRVHIVSSNGSPAILGLVASGQVSADVGQSGLSEGYAAFDQALRVLTDNTPFPRGDSNIPIRIFTANNVGTAGNPPQFGVGYGSTAAIRAGFLKSWRLAS